METYIFNCYYKWLKDNREREGNIFKRISNLTIFAKVLIAFLLITLVAGVAVFVLSYSGIIHENYILIPVIVEGILGVITYLYTIYKPL